MWIFPHRREPIKAAVTPSLRYGLNLSIFILKHGSSYYIEKSEISSTSAITCDRFSHKSDFVKSIYGTAPLSQGIARYLSKRLICN
jgi:hypothetical protein